MLGQVPGQPIRIGLKILACFFLAWYFLEPHKTHAETPSLETSETLKTVEPIPPIVLELTDSALISEVWATVNEEAELPTGEVQILLPHGPEILPEGQEPEGYASLLLNGSEIGRLDRAEWQAIASRTLKENGKGWRVLGQGADRQEIPVVWKVVKANPQALLSHLQWPSGILLGMNTFVSSVPSARPQVQRDFEFAWSQKLYTHFLLGFDLHRSQFGGGLTYAALEAKRRAGLGSAKPQVSTLIIPSTKTRTPYWGDGYWGWSLTAGIPGIKYTLALADKPLPKYFWLDPRAAKALKTYKTGSLINQWADSSFENPGNFAHTLEARIGYLRYGFHFDTDAYRVPIQTFYLDELPAFFGTWGTGLVMASDILATRLWMDLPDLTLPLSRPTAYPSDFRFVFLRLDLAYRNIRNFNLGISVRIHIDNPLLNLPGV